MIFKKFRKIMHLAYLIIALILLTKICIANPNWNNYGNIGSKYASNNGANFLAFSTVYTSNYNTSFAKCSIPYNPSTSPVIFDIDGDLVTNEIVFVSGNSIYAYNRFCDRIAISSFTGSQISGLYVMNSNADSLADVCFMANDGGGKAKCFQYNASTQSLEQIKNVIISSANGTVSYGACSFYSNTCVFVNSKGCYGTFLNGSKFNSSINFNSGFDTIPLSDENFAFPIQASETYGAWDWTIGFFVIPFPIPMAVPSYNIYQYNFTKQVFPMTALIGSDFNTILLNMFSCGIEYSSVSGTATSCPAPSSGNDRMKYSAGNFINENFPLQLACIGGTNLPNKTNLKLFSYNLSVLDSVTPASNTFFSGSNIVIADVNYDNQREYCFATANTSGGNYTLTCKSLGGSTLFSMDYMNYTSSDRNVDFSMAKMISGSLRMQVVNTLGIWNLDSGNMSLQIPFGLSKTANVTGGVLIVDLTPLSPNNPSGDEDVIVRDGSQISVISISQISGFCGDGICYGESVLTCSEDCNVTGQAFQNNTGDTCIKNSDCLSGLCEYHTCVLKGGGEACVLSSQCISGLCRSHICTKPTLWAQIEQSKDELAGDDSNTNNLIAIIIMIISSVAIASSLQSIFGSILASGVFIAEAVFFTIAGWLSPFILFGVILIIVIFAIMIFMLGIKE